MGSAPFPYGHALLRRRERLELLCGEIRRSLTAMHIAIPASITGLPMERIPENQRPQALQGGAHVGGLNRGRGLPEVAALERLAAMRGDTAGGMQPEG